MFERFTRREKPAESPVRDPAQAIYAKSPNQRLLSVQESVLPAQWVAFCQFKVWRFAGSRRNEGGFDKSL